MYVHIQVNPKQRRSQTLSRWRERGKKRKRKKTTHSSFSVSLWSGLLDIKNMAVSARVLCSWVCGSDIINKACKSVQDIMSRPFSGFLGKEHPEELVFKAEEYFCCIKTDRTVRSLQVEIIICTLLGFFFFLHFQANLHLCMVCH